MHQQQKKNSVGEFSLPKHTKMSQLKSAPNRPAATLLLLLLAAAAAAAAAELGGVPSPCKGDIDALQKSCYQYVRKDTPKEPPSPACCSAMKALAGEDVPCICDYLSSPPVKETISKEKVLYVTKQCGVTVPKNCLGDHRRSRQTSG
ncbi:hypothetical protein ACP4OV_003423 [Aristida adscensionis]